MSLSEMRLGGGGADASGRIRNRSSLTASVTVRHRFYTRTFPHNEPSPGLNRLNSISMRHLAHVGCTTSCREAEEWIDPGQFASVGSPALTRNRFSTE